MTEVVMPIELVAGDAPAELHDIDTQDIESVELALVRPQPAIAREVGAVALDEEDSKPRRERGGYAVLQRLNGQYTTDSVNHYLKEIGRYPLLTKAEEQTLSRARRSGIEAQDELKAEIQERQASD